jgi:hypothetical protein
MQELFAHVKSFHHGDCIGVDHQAALIADELGIHTTCHPPLNNSLRVHHPSTEILTPMGYKQRNRHIVDSVSLVIVVPLDTTTTSSGTWTTYRYATGQSVPRIIIYRDGTVEQQLQTS